MSRVALVVGSAVGALQEYAQFKDDFRSPDGVFLVNDAIKYVSDPATAAVTLHPEKMSVWLRSRYYNSFNSPESVIPDTWKDWFKILGRPPELPFVPSLVLPQMFPDQVSSGSSGLFAVKVALVDYGYDRVVCCGVPMDADRAHIHKQRSPWRGANRHRKGWEEAKASLIGRVTSMSGWTADFLGRPSKRWLR